MSQHVLVPVDGSAAAERAMAYVIKELSGPTVTFLHVIDPGEDSEASEQGATEEASSPPPRETDTVLEAYRDRAEAHGAPAETRTVVGRPVDRILNAAETDSADHIVLGSRSEKATDLGGVAEAVTRRAPVPVTVVR